MVCLWLMVCAKTIADKPCFGYKVSAWVLSGGLALFEMLPYLMFFAMPR